MDQANSSPGPAGAGAGSTARYPLHLTLTVAFVGIFLIFGMALIAFNYLESRKIALASADDLVERIAAHLNSSISELYQPVRGLVDILADSRLLEGDSLDERPEVLDALVDALRLHPAMSAVYAGRDDGGNFLVRSLEGRPETHERLDAPPDSRFVVQAQERLGDGSGDDRLLFYDDALRLLESRPLELSFDPRERQWYVEAIASEDQVTTDFYRFFTTGEIGVTFARRLRSGAGVVGADLALDDLSAGLSRQRVTASTRILVVDADGRVIALSSPLEASSVTPSETDGTAVRLPRLADLSESVYLELATQFETPVTADRFEVIADGRTWLASISRLPTRKTTVFLAVLIPRDELLADADRIRNQSILISLALLVIAVGLVTWLARQASSSLRALAADAEKIRRFKLASPISVRSRILEVDDLASTMSLMKSTLQRFFEISRALSVEKDERRLLEMILRETMKVSHADGGAILMTSEDEERLEVAILENERTGAHFGGTSGREPTLPSVALREATAGPEGPSLDSETVRRSEMIRVDDIEAERAFDASAVCARFAADDYEVGSLLSVPLTDQKDDIVGLLQLVNARDVGGAVTGFDPEVESYIEALASDAAVALDLRRLLKAQKDLLDSFILVVAGAIDAKSAYTHGHCQRVPVIAEMLARAAHDAEEGPFADFHLSTDEWYELHISSWLHDCGKVTTPEYVVDKATRLETLTNRIHEVRTRFEVLWRDAEIEYLEALANSPSDRAMLRQRLEDRLEALKTDFEFVAECNLSETYMDEERIARLERIGATTWLRHFDDRLGLAHEELARKGDSPTTVLPVPEPLLADKPDHVIERPDDGPVFGDDPHGFRMEVPEHTYNRGELYNLGVARGTLTAEERFKINEHVIETIKMLGRLPFPRELRRVPAWAGNHHEKLDGTGYPRRLEADELSVPERIMAIADVFEALTATDRPYMKPKSLSTALRILRSMCDSGHLCPDLYELFLTSGVHRQYGGQYLRPDQLDEIDLEDYLAG